MGVYCKPGNIHLYMQHRAKLMELRNIIEEMFEGMNIFYSQKKVDAFYNALHDQPFSLEAIKKIIRTPGLKENPTVQMILKEAKQLYNANKANEMAEFIKKRESELEAKGVVE